MGDVRWDQAEQVTFTRRRSTRDPLGEVFTVDTAPAVTILHAELLDQAEERKRWGEPCPLSLEDDGRVVRWRFDNCRCAYRIVDYSQAKDAYLLERFAAMGDSRG